MRCPQKLDQLIGNRHFIDLLRRGSLPQSAIFCGPDGVGKKTTALLLSALRNCRAPLEDDLCGSCTSCIKAAQGNHPDITLITSERTAIPIEAIRSLNKESQYRPFEGNARFFVVDEAQKMTMQAANAILKTLEEPPPTTHIILVTAYPDALLPTIRSRCQMFSFQALQRQEIQGYLEYQTELKDSELRASFARGSIGRALSLDLEELLSERDQMLTILQSWLENRDFGSIFDFTENAALRAKMKKRDSVLRFLEQIQLLCYDIYFLNAETPERVVNVDRREQLSVFNSPEQVKEVREILVNVEESRKDLERNANPLMTFDAVWLKSIRSS